MEKTLAAAAFALLLTVPAMAQTLDTMLPSLTWPEDDVTVSTKGCEGQVPAVCTTGK